MANIKESTVRKSPHSLTTVAINRLLSTVLEQYSTEELDVDHMYVRQITINIVVTGKYVGNEISARTLKERTRYYTHVAIQTIPKRYDDQ